MIKTDCFQSTITMKTLVQILKQQCVFFLLVWYVHVVSTMASDDDAKMIELSNRFFNWRLKENPEYGSNLGITDFAGDVEEYTEAAFERQIKNVSALLKEVKTLNPAKMATQNRISFQVLTYNLQSFIDGYNYRKYGMYNLVTPMERPTDDWLRNVERMNFNTISDYRIYLERLQKLPNLISQQITLMRMAISNKITAHNSSLTGALVSIDKQIVSNATMSDSYEPFTRMPDTIASNFKIEIQHEGERIIKDEIIPAWQNLRAFIVNEYSPATRPNISISSLPGGLEFYKICLKWHTTVDWSPETIHQKGHEEVARIEGLMDKIKTEQGYNGTLLEFIGHLNKQRENFFDTEDAMLDGYRAIVAEVHNKLPQILLKSPKGAVVVKKATNPQSSPRYSEPPLDNSRPGEFIANVFYPTMRPKYNMKALTLHEAEPGHHMMFVYAMETNMPNFRRAIEFRKCNTVPFTFPFHTAYVEGWGLYAESLGEEMNIYSDSLSLFGRYASELIRACRLVVDTGIHAFGWSKEQAMNYATLHTTTSSVAAIENEINRYIAWPGQACSYKIGEFKILELRKKAESALGSKFDKRQFHHEVLQLGPVPLFVLEKSIDEWIAATSSTTRLTFYSLNIVMAVATTFLSHFFL